MTLSCIQNIPYISISKCSTITTYQKKQQKLLLFQVHQHTIAVLGMEKHDRFTMSSYSWLGGETSDILALHISDSCCYIIHLYADVVYPPSLVLGQKTCDWRFLPKWVQQL